MIESKIANFFKDVNVPYAIYGNFNFIAGENEDIDVLIQERNFTQVKDYLIQNDVSFHEREYYPGQIFVTGTDIKIHVTKDLFIGGRRVAYLLKLSLIDDLISNSISWNSYKIINLQDYVKYRRIKKIFNSKKELKITEYPTELSSDTKDTINNIELIIFTLKILIQNSMFIIPRFLKKRVWVRL